MHSFREIFGPWKFDAGIHKDFPKRTVLYNCRGFNVTFMEEIKTVLKEEKEFENELESLSLADSGLFGLSNFWFIVLNETFPDQNISYFLKNIWLITSCKNSSCN